jgi:DME family drug/metabolite transporter
MRAGVVVPSETPVAVSDRLRILAAALLFSTGGAAIKACSLSALEVASLRSMFAAVTVLLILPEARRGWTWRTWFVGASYAATLVLYVLGNKLTTAANTIFLQSTAPIYILLLSPLLLHERIRRSDLAFMAAIAGGMTLFFIGVQAPQITAPNPMLGNILAACAGVTWAITILGLRWLGRSRSGGGPAAVACGNLLAAGVVFPFALPLAAPSATDWLIVSLLGILQIGIAYAFLTGGLRGVPAFEASLLLLVEPVLNPIWAWLIHGETPTRWASLGGAFILIATTLHTAAAQYRNRPPAPGRDTMKP